MREMNLNQFLEQLASAAPVPGGGGASALAGALGIALGNMVGSLTVGKKKYAAVEDEIRDLNEKAAALREELLCLVEKDAEVFEPLSKAYGIPKDDPGREEVMANVLKAAAEVPLAIMKKCCEALDLITVYADKGSVLAVSDAGCAASLCRAAMESAALNVYINTKSMADRQLAETLNREVCAMLQEYSQKADAIYQSVSGRLH
ncbi:MAG: cyclodeaminase/cyclohydrolase family protein [Anaerovoracaceae bacterium]|nr:cyclodeaminase/cyclohydrolase family protein [Anaerovoracaceae bacterium]